MKIQALGNTGYQDSTAYSPPTKQFVTEAEYWEKYYDYPDITYEWNNGQLEEKPVSDYLTFLTYEWFWKLLGYYLTTKPIAKTVGLEMGFRLTITHKTVVRRPDLGIVLNNNKVPLLPKDKSYKGTFDLCIEAISDSTKADIKRDTEVKANEYAQGRVKEYYILDGHDRYSGFYRLETDGIYHPISAQKGIIKSTTLPGFQFRFEDLYHCPPIVDMTKDKIYKDFVLPDYSKALERAKQRAEKAEQQVEIETSARQEAEQQTKIEALAKQEAEQHAKRLTEQLRSLGIEPDNIH